MKRTRTAIGSKYMTLEVLILAYEASKSQCIPTISTTSSGSSFSLLRRCTARRPVKATLTKLEKYKDSMTSLLYALAAGPNPSVPVPRTELFHFKSRVTYILIVINNYRHEEQHALLNKPAGHLEAARLVRSGLSEERNRTD